MHDNLEEQLKAYGIKLSDDKSYILIANKNRYLAEFTGHEKWGPSLKRIQGAESKDATSFGGKSNQHRCTAIPIELVIEAQLSPQDTEVV